MSISFQLYSARNYQPWEQVIATLAAEGYTQVEGFGPVYDNPQAFRALLDQHGMSMPTGHFSLDLLEQDLPKALSIAETLSIKKIVCPWLAPDQRPTTSAGWKAIAARLAAIDSKVRAAGYGFAWHNHDFEFKPCTDDGSIPQALLMDGVPTLEWEADIAWVVRGDANPLEWIQRYGSRITVAHVKDIAAVGTCLDEDGWADAGHGTMDWKTIALALYEAGTPLFVMEHDNPNDLVRFASRSRRAFQAL